jgi:hypothetical protein
MELNTDKQEDYKIEVLQSAKRNECSKGLEFSKIHKVYEALWPKEAVKPACWNPG